MEISKFSSKGNFVILLKRNHTKSLCYPPFYLLLTNSNYLYIINIGNEKTQPVVTTYIRCNTPAGQSKGVLFYLFLICTNYANNC